MRTLPRKCTLTLLGHVLLTAAACGVPAWIRTDNEAMFTSALWHKILKALGIKHRKTQIASPWQNGRIERVFGTLKAVLKQIRPDTPKALRRTLKDFATFYNRVRIHQNLNGLTPMEVWEGKTLVDVQKAHATQPGCWVSACNEQLVGYYVRC